MDGEDEGVTGVPSVPGAVDQPADADIGLVAVVGAGTMGAGIAQVALAAGQHVVLFDAVPGVAELGAESVRSRLDRLVEKDQLGAEARDRMVGSLKVASGLSDFADAGIVVEAVIEDLDVKKTLFREIESIVSERCILASNTSSLSITAIAAGLDHPGRCLGMHFFNPAPLMALVEIVTGLQTADETADIIASLAYHWGKTPVRCRSIPGFIVNRIARPYYGEALRSLEEGRGDIKEIDSGMRAAGFRMGPFELMDLVGLDVNLAVSTSVWQATGFDPRYTPSWIQREYVAAGMLGRKSGRGFYDYADEEHPVPRPADRIPPDAVADGDDLRSVPDGLLARTVCLVVNAAAELRMLDVATGREIDTAVRLGLNYPLGPLEWGDRIGAARVVELLDTMEALYRDGRYRVMPWLRERAALGRSLLDE